MINFSNKKLEFQELNNTLLTESKFQGIINFIESSPLTEGLNQEAEIILGNLPGSKPSPIISHSLSSVKAEAHAAKSASDINVDAVADALIRRLKYLGYA